MTLRSRKKKARSARINARADCHLRYLIFSPSLIVQDEVGNRLSSPPQLSHGLAKAALCRARDCDWNHFSDQHTRITFLSAV